jgi:amidohydrolase
MENDLVELRHQLHSIAEASGEEHRTKSLISSEILKLQGWKIISESNEKSVALMFDSGNPGKTLCFRAELDGLPQEETSDLPWISKNPGYSHICGHDGHMAILAGLAGHITKHPPAEGRIILLFQSAEENGNGASELVSEGFFQRYKTDLIIGLHNIPGEDEGSIIIRDGVFSASVKSAEIHLNGKAAHASEPEKGINPALYLASLIKAAHEIQQTDPMRSNFFLVTPTYINAGSMSHGTAAGEADVHLTFRAWNDHLMEQKIQHFMYSLSLLSQEHKIRTSMRFTDIFPSVINQKENNDILRKAALAAGYKISEQQTPFRWGEDFGVYASQAPSLFFGLGAGSNCKALHTAGYDFPDSLLSYGINLFGTLIKILR